MEKGVFQMFPASAKTSSLLRFCRILGDIEIFTILYNFINLSGKAGLSMASCIIYVSVSGKFVSLGAGVICYQSHCYTRIAIPTLLLSVTATNWIATTISATDINCYLLPLLQPELLSSFTATLHFCYKGTLAYKLVD